MYNISQLTELEEGWFFYDHAWILLHHLVTKIRGESLLDVGCGTGVALSVIKALKPLLTVEGIEPSSDAREIWNKRNIKVVVGTATCLPFDDNSYDSVISSHVIEHIHDDALAIREIFRVAKKRSIIVVPSGNVDEKNPGSPHVHYYNRINFKELIVQNLPETSTFEVYNLSHPHISNLIAVVDHV